MTPIGIRRVTGTDSEQWQLLWRSYDEFYARNVEERTTNRVWDALVHGTGDPYGYVAVQNGIPVGFTHYFFVRSTSDWGPRCYMQDLFADPSVRGCGVGRALIEAVYADADRNDAAQAYWLTATSNTTAQKLYDRVAKKTLFVKYQR